MAAIELFSVALLIPLFSAVLIGESGAESVPLLLGFDLPSFKNTDGNLNLLISIAFIALLSKATLSMVLSYWQTKLSNHVTIMLRRRIIQKNDLILFILQTSLTLTLLEFLPAY